MERNYRTIMEQHLRKLEAEVTMAAISTVPQGILVSGLKPNFYRFVYIMSGGGWLEVGGERYEARAGHLFMLPAGSEQSYAIEGSEPCVYAWCHFNANLGDAELMHTINLPACVDMAERPEIIRLFEGMIASFNDSAITSQLRLKAALYEILACYLEQCEVDESRIADIDLYVKLAAVLDYIDKHLADNMTLEDLAKIAYLHPNYFISLFKNTIGYSPIQYVNRQRLETAKKLLSDTDIPVTDIAAAIGMQNHYLSRMFKQHTGISPSRYRQLYKESCERQVAEQAHAEATSGTYRKPYLAEAPAADASEQSAGREAAAKPGAGNGSFERRRAQDKP